MRYALAISAVLLLSTPAAAQSVALNWNQVTLDINGQPENIQGYYVEYGTQQGGPYGLGHSTGSTGSTQIDNLTNGQTYYFRIQAIDVGGNSSGWSNEASWVVPTEDCFNGIDDDLDGLTDCQDTECTGSPEDCNGIDDDCDGQIDNLAGPACPLQDGVCSGSTQACAGASGWQACTTASYGTDYEQDESTCDGLDNDCDGSTDEGLPGPGCALQQGVCAGSVQRCDGTGGWLPCDGSDYGAGYEASDETLCDQLDNDCDGSTDENVSGCCTDGQTTPCGTDEGECTAGVQTCDAAGIWGPCDGTPAGTESCDGLDNDCDGSTDEELTGPACVLQQGVCAGSSQLCGGAGGWSACDAAAYGADYQQTETSCDGLDNDCDGQPDNGLTGPPCQLTQGVCAGTTQVCGGAGGWTACGAGSYGGSYEQTEATCDQLDNDCDGSTDEDIGGCCTDGETTPCGTDEGECSAGQQTCEAGGTWGSCDGIDPVAEVCDQLDNDCDTLTDEDGVCDQPDGGVQDGSTVTDDWSEIEIHGGCSCATGRTGGLAWLLWLLPAWALWRRRTV